MGLLFAAQYYSDRWGSHEDGAFSLLPFLGSGSGDRAWVPALVFAATGFLLLAPGLWAGRRAEPRR